MKPRFQAIKQGGPVDSTWYDIIDTEPTTGEVLIARAWTERNALLITDALNG